MEIKYMHLLEGAQKAEGIAVIIDVFRAFSLEAYMFAAGIKLSYPVESLDKARELKDKNPDYLLFGEREGIIQPGFDYGNSPSQILEMDLEGRTVVHASSSGTRGLVAAMASRAEEVISGSFVNAAAIARYLKAKAPETVTLVDMGWAGRYATREDTICASYLSALLSETEFREKDYVYEIYKTDGRRFFDPENHSSMPVEDFFLCLRPDIFDFVLKADNDENGLIMLQRFDS